jgi:hypothetical protein
MSGIATRSLPPNDVTCPALLVDAVGTLLP